MNVSVSNVTQQTTAVAPVVKAPEIERTAPRAAAQPVHDTVTLSGQMPQKVVYGDPRIGKNRPRPGAGVEQPESEQEAPDGQAQPAANPKK